MNCLCEGNFLCLFIVFGNTVGFLSNFIKDLRRKHDLLSVPVKTDRAILIHLCAVSGDSWPLELGPCR